MARRTGSQQHEAALRRRFTELEALGYRCIDLKGLSPDGIAVLSNGTQTEIIAVEAINIGKHGKSAEYHKKGKRRSYSMFDNVDFVLFKRK